MNGGIDSNKTTVRVNISTLHRHRFTNVSEYERDSHALILFDEVRGGLPEHDTKHAYKLRAVIVNGGTVTVYTRDFEQDQDGAWTAAAELHDRLLKRCERQVEGYGLPLEKEEGWFIASSSTPAKLESPKRHAWDVTDDTGERVTLTCRDCKLPLRLYATSSACDAPTVEDRFDDLVKPEVRTNTVGRRAVFMDDARITEWTDGDPLTALLVPWLAEMLGTVANGSDTDRNIPNWSADDFAPRDEKPTTKHGTIPPKGDPKKGWKCGCCGEPATCFGSYEMREPDFACDKCCGHGCEDGRCLPTEKEES